MSLSIIASWTMSSTRAMSTFTMIELVRERKYLKVDDEGKEREKGRMISNSLGNNWLLCSVASVSSSFCVAASNQACTEIV